VRIARLRSADIDAMRPAGAFVADVLHDLVGAAQPGVNLLELDALAHERIRTAGATSCYIDYHPSFGASPFGKVLCTSVNDAALHGLPRDYTLQTGDLLSVDFAVELGGWVADSARSTVVGQGHPDDHTLITATEEALRAGIDQARPGKRLGDIQAAIGQVGRRYGYSINTDFGGHGVGRTMHEEPSIPNDGDAGTGPLLKPGMVFAIEPWFMHTTDELVVDADGWTLRSADGSRAAHSEHTVAITAEGPLVLTERPS
jgi:methionyl aminopeptidase